MTVIIGLEIHCQLNTKTKLFCGCSTGYQDSEPNTHVCPVCAGLPGSLPVTNKKAVEYALKVAKALHCHVPPEAEFARKNYFYPDLPKGFQITQYDKPLAVLGSLLIDGDDGEKAVRITRVHMEEDPGRLVHKGGGDRPRYTLVDYNRSGIPLIEIVTEPDLRSPKEARKFLNKIRATLEYLGVFDSDREGSLRVDANISMEGHARVEIKNISSYKGVEKALTFEVTRQRNAIRRGVKIDRETRHFVEARGITTSSRSKEEENDYRYFPEPDLPSLRVSGWVDAISLPELPDARRHRFVEQYGCSSEHARTLTGGIRLACFYEDVARVDPILAATWVSDILLGELSYRGMGIERVPVQVFRDLLEFIRDGTITDKSGIDVLRTLLDQIKENGECESAGSCIARFDLGKKAGDEIGDVIDTVLSSNPEAVSDVRAGKKGAVHFLVGRVMKETRGRADPAEVNRMLLEAFARLEG